MNAHSNSRIPLAGMAILIVVVAGLVVDADKAEKDNFYADIIRLDNVVTKIHQNYVEEVNSQDIVDKAVAGMLSILDPHTSYFKTKDYEELRIHTEGKFGGLGIQISIRDKVLTVMTPIMGTPAARAGIQSGDQIIKIDGKPTKGITIDKAVGKLRGEPGTEVSIVIRRRGEAGDIDYTIKREIIEIPSVPYCDIYEDGIGYLTLSTFSQEAGAEVEKGIRELVGKGLKGLILDLRFNPGGLLPQAIEVSEKFLPKKSLVVSTRGRVKGQNKESYAQSGPVLPPEVPLVVLVNYASASASEIVAGAVQDWDRAVIVGDTTFGKGSVQSILPLDQTHHLKLTTAFYYTPSGRCINKPENDIRGVLDEDEEGPEAAVGEGDGEMEPAVGKKRVSDDTTTFKTNNGRIMHGGGGIVPDTVVLDKRASLAVSLLVGKDAFFKFANLEYPKLKAKKVKIDNGFQVDDRTMKDFYAFLDSIDFTFQSLAQVRFNEFKTGAGLVDSTQKADTAFEKQLQARLNDSLLNDQEKAQLAAIAGEVEKILSKAGERAMQKSDHDIRDLIKQALLVRELGQDNKVVFRKRLEMDAQFKAAFAIVQQKDLYKRLLEPPSAAKTGK